MNEFEQALGRYLTDAQLKKIQSVKVGIAGAGGLGSNCAMALVRTGFRHLKIVDFDVVDYSNLNRQFYFSGQVGQTKVDALRENLSLVNPDVVIEIVPFKLDARNIKEVFEECDLVVEAFDRPECKKLVVEAYLGSKFVVSASGLAGFGDSDRIKVHRIKRNFYIVGDLASGVDTDTPPLAPCVLIAAAKQADIVLSYTLGTPEGSSKE